MKLIDCVESLSTHTLQKILKHHPPYTIQTEEGSTLSFLLDAVYLHHQWEKMKPSERYMLLTLLAHTEEGYLPYHKMEDRIEIPIAESIVGLTLLRQKGIVFTHRRYYGEIGYFLPEDVSETLLRVFNDMKQPEVCDLSQQYFNISQFYEGLWSMMHYIRCNPLPLTQKGWIHKRYVGQLEEQIAFFHSAVDKLIVEYEGSHYSKGLALLLDYAIMHELVGESGDRLKVDRQVVNDWIHLTEAEKKEQLWRYMRRKIAPYYPLETRLLLEWLYLLPIGKRMKWEDFLSFLQRLRFDSTVFSDVQSIDLLQTMHAFGLIVVLEEEGTWWIGRPHIREHMEAQAYIASNLQIMVPAVMPIAIRWQIGEFAELVQFDQMITYEFTKKSIEQAVEFGWSEKTIIHFLHSIVPKIPDNVIHMIHQWIEECTKLRFMDVLVLECKDNHLLTELKAQAIFAPYIIAELSSRHLIIQRSKLVEFRRTLIDSGYTPMKSILTYDEENTDVLHPTSQILRTQFFAYRSVENVYPEWEDAFPGIRSIPKTWIDTFRTYHPSSLIDLLKRAEQHHLKLSFKLNDDKRIDKISPISIQQIGGDWMLRYRTINTENAESTMHEEWLPVKEIHEVAVHLPY